MERLFSKKIKYFIDRNIKMQLKHKYLLSSDNYGYLRYLIRGDNPTLQA